MNIFYSFLLAFSISIVTFASKEVGNGGNEIALDFLKSANQMLSIYKKELKTYPQLKGKDIVAVLNKTTVLISSTPLKVELRGENQEVTAINYKNPFTIIVNEKRWLAIKLDAVREALALHELLGLMDVEKTGEYFISKNYLVKNGINCSNELCESPTSSDPNEIFCRFQNNWYPNLKTYKFRYLCKGNKKEFTIYCDLWKDPVEFNGNKIDALGGVWNPRDKKGGILSYTYPDEGGKFCTYDDTKDDLD